MLAAGLVILLATAILVPVYFAFQTMPRRP